MKTSPSFLLRMMRFWMARWSRLRTVFRWHYRRRIGIRYDRRFRDGKSAPPTNVTLALTYRCNLDCLMCRQRRTAASNVDSRPWYDPKRELPSETWKHFLDQVQWFRPAVYITGGEPLLYPHFEELVHHAKSRDLVVQLQTNGVRLAKVADFLVSEGVEGVTVSLDGPPHVHDTIRRVEGTFSKIQEGVQALVESRQVRKKPGPILAVNFVITKFNYQTMEEVVGIAIGLDADFIQVQHTMFNSPEKIAEHNEILSPERVEAMGLRMHAPSVGEGAYYVSEIESDDIPKLLDAMKRSRRRAKGRINFLVMPNIPDELVPHYYLDLDYPFLEGCDNFWKTMRVNPDGTVSPCMNLIVGNIANQSFAEMWNGEVMQRLREHFSKGLLPACLRCCQRHFCKPGTAF